jgi:transcriptional regulator with XRE-family HTH domain
MPRPNKPRDVLAESNLAKRIAAERDARGWTNDGLARRMTDAGCAMTGSAIFKIEKGAPPRRIVVDELVAFAKVFGVSVEELLLPPEVAARRELARLVIEWNTSDDEARAAATKRDEAWEALQTYTAEHPDSAPTLEVIFGEWADTYFDEENREGAAAYKMWQLTRDPRWIEIVRADVNRGIDPAKAGLEEGRDG